MKTKKLFPIFFLVIALASCSIQNRVYGHEKTDWNDRQKTLIASALGEDVVLPYIAIPGIDVYSVSTEFDFGVVTEGVEPVEPQKINVVLLLAPNGRDEHVTTYTNIISTSSDPRVNSLTPLTSESVKKSLEDYTSSIPLVTLPEAPEDGRLILKRDINDKYSLFTLTTLLWLETTEDDETGVSNNKNFGVLAFVLDKDVLYVEVEKLINEKFDEYIDDAPSGNVDPEELGTAISEAVESGNVTVEEAEALTISIPEVLFPENTTVVSNDNGFTLETVLPEGIESEDVLDALDDFGVADKGIEHLADLMIAEVEKNILDAKFVKIGYLEKSDTNQFKQYVYVNYDPIPGSSNNLICFLHADTVDYKIVYDYHVMSASSVTANPNFVSLTIE